MANIKIQRIRSLQLFELDLLMKIAPELTQCLMSQFNEIPEIYRMKVDRKLFLGERWLRRLSLHSKPACFLGVTDKRDFIHAIDALVYVAGRGPQSRRAADKIDHFAAARAIEYYYFVRGLDVLSSREIKRSCFFQDSFERVQSAAQNYELDLGVVLAKAVASPEKVRHEMTKTYGILARHLRSSLEMRASKKFLHAFRSRIETSYAIADVLVFDLHHGLRRDTK